MKKVVDKRNPYVAPKVKKKAVPMQPDELKPQPKVVERHINSMMKIGLPIKGLK